jgi:hypothetical protein
MLQKQVDGLTLEKADMLRQIQVRGIKVPYNSCGRHMCYIWLCGVCMALTGARYRCGGSAGSCRSHVCVLRLACRCVHGTHILEADAKHTV